MDIAPQIAPFWFTPPNQREGENVRFKLKPLTQPQIVEIMDTFKNGEPTSTTWYRAGEMALNGCGDIENLTINGKPARWPAHASLIPYKLIAACGMEVCVQAWSLDREDAGKN